VSMESVALAADVAKGTLYKHFPAKESLIGHRFDSDRRAQAKKINAAVMAKNTCAERLALRLQIEAQYIEKIRRYMAPYLRYKLAGQPASQRSATPEAVEVFIAELLAVGQSAGEITSTIPAEHLAEYLRLLRLAVLVRWLQTPGASLNAMNEEMLRLFLHGAKTQAQVPS
jgi:AcrR family transcriptional regulator